MRKSLIILALPALLVLGCKPPNKSPGNVAQTPPKACFTINKALIDSGETITTTNCSTHATSYVWNFGVNAQSASVATTPSYAYTNPKRGNSYQVSLIAFGSGILQNEKDTTVIIGYRRIDSVVVKNINGFTPDGATQLVFQFGPQSNNYTSAPVIPSIYPFTYSYTGLTPKVYISSANNGKWDGRMIQGTGTGSTLYAWIPSSPFYVSRGLDNSPIEFKDNSTPATDFLIYYSLSPTNK